MALNRAQRDRMGRGWEHHRNRRYAEAEPFYRQVFAQAPDDPEVVHLLGVVVLRQGRTDEALTLLGKAAALVPGSVEIQNDLGMPRWRGRRSGGRSITTVAVRCRRWAARTRPWPAMPRRWR